MTARSRYEEFCAELSADPLSAAVGLVRSNLFDRYLVYEKNGVFTVAGGIAGQVVADHARIRAVWQNTETSLPWDAKDLRPLAGLLDSLPVADWRVYGWAAFELSYPRAGLPVPPSADPLLHLVLPRVEVSFSPGQVRGRALDGVEREKVLEQLLECAGTPPGGDDGAEAVQPRCLGVEGDDAAAYQEAVRQAVEHIEQRRLQKVILSRVLPVDFEVDLVGTYAAGRRRNTPARSFLFDFGQLRGAGFSPETVAEVSPEGVVTTQPLAGTRARSDVREIDERLRSDLLRNAKEIYEHAISVKASFEELQHVCDPASVRVNDFMSVKQRGSVQHLGSRVTGDLAAERTAWDAFTALFPGITASGIPKPAAYREIRQHEPSMRGPYAGAVLTAGADGGLDAALVLRSVFQRDGRTWLRAGAGIVEQSDPAREYEETCEKLRSVAGCLMPQPSSAVLLG
ncbi:salicylate synthase [Streptomyces sp. RK75]|uniref:salicylate synthase n=1 Tax=Streptomyces sp. RK75 TaxID=2824895 RepID=UPI000C18591E|nr:salicylate synthase [Streptomyces sp. RK75]MBQ0867126.1 salicylate synthase [Streptomyces sp. RK75]